MLIPTDEDLLAEELDRLLELYELRAETEERGCWAQLEAIEEQIASAKAQRNDLRQRDIVGAASGGRLMAKQEDPAARRHRREKAVIEHVSRDVKPERKPTDQGTPSPSTETGLPVEDQVRKEWDPGKGGLPTF